MFPPKVLSCSSQSFHPLLCCGCLWSELSHCARGPQEIALRVSVKDLSGLQPPCFLTRNLLWMDVYMFALLPIIAAP